MAKIKICHSNSNKNIGDPVAIIAITSMGGIIYGLGDDGAIYTWDLVKKEWNA